jgi:uncharacterized protein (TIGR00369 family)
VSGAPGALDPLDDTALAAIRSLMEEQIPFNRFLGMKLVEARRGFAKLEVPFRDELVGDPVKPALHGGVMSTLADTVGGCAVFTVIDPTARCSTVDLRVDYLRPGKLETLSGEAHVLRVGGRVVVSSIKIYQRDPEAPIAVAMGVYAVRRARGEPPS